MVLAIKTTNLWIGYLNEDESITWANKNINIEVDEGESFCIVGESGCGKTTFINAIAGILPPHSVTKGILTILDRVVINDNTHSYNGIRGRVVSLIPQNPGTSLNPFMTIKDHFYHVIRSQRMVNREEVEHIASSYLSRVGLDSNVLRRYPHQLSVGMQQRVLIALALTNKAKIIVADEPTSSIDANLKTHAINLLNDLRAEYRLTLVIVTHEILIARSLCNRIAVMYSGRIVEIGPVRKVLETPSHPYTRMLIECIPVLGVMKELKPLPGEPLEDTGNYNKCPFIDRCPLRIDICSVQEPPLIPLDNEKTHYVACWRAGEIK